MRTLIACSVLLALGTSLVAQIRKSDFYLDVPGQTRSDRPPGSSFPRRNSVSGMTHATIPCALKLSLVSIERTDSAYGDFFTYEVMIESPGKEAVSLPWSPNAGAFAQPAPRT